MKFVTISRRYYDALSADPQMLFRENRRPHLLVLTLDYKHNRYNFAVPLRSNIPHYEPRDHYFALPPRPATMPGNHHGLHYIKMFPICRSAQERFWVGDNPSYLLYQDIIKRNERSIVQDCQQYLDTYAQGVKPQYAVDIDLALRCMAEFMDHPD